MTVEEGLANLKEAVTQFFESAGSNEDRRRLRMEIFVTRFDAAYG